MGNIEFKNECKRATLIQGAVQSDSIIARSQRSKEFCNTIEVRADIALTCQNVRYWHKADIPSCTAHVRFTPKADMTIALRNVRL